MGRFCALNVLNLGTEGCSQSRPLLSIHLVSKPRHSTVLFLYFSCTGCEMGHFILFLAWRMYLLLRKCEIWADQSSFWTILCCWACGNSDFCSQIDLYCEKRLLFKLDWNQSLKLVANRVISRSLSDCLETDFQKSGQIWLWKTHCFSYTWGKTIKIEFLFFMDF